MCGDKIAGSEFPIHSFFLLSIYLHFTYEIKNFNVII